MERRGFLKRLIGGAAAIAVAPQLLAQADEHLYAVSPEEVLPIDRVFTKNNGLWVYSQDKLVAWSILSNVNIEMVNNPIEITSNEFDLGSYRTFLPGKTCVYFNTDQLHIIDQSVFDFNQDNKLGIICKVDDIVFEGEGICSELSSTFRYLEAENASAKFDIIGEVTITHNHD